MTHKPPKPLDIDRELKHARWGMYVLYASLLLVAIASADAIYLERRRDAAKCLKNTLAPTPSLIDSTSSAADKAAHPTDKSADRQREEPKP